MKPIRPAPGSGGNFRDLSTSFVAAGYGYRLDKLNSFDGDFVRAEMVKAFLDSDEYRKRFGQ